MNTRGQSTTIGTVLVISITVAAATATVGAAVLTLDESRTQANEERAEIAAAEFDSAAALVALGEPDGTTTVGLGDADSVTVSDSGTISVISRSNETDTILVNQTLGAVEYNTDGDTLAYQGGGVWRQGDNYAQMVSPPEFDFNGETLTLPIVRVTANETPTQLSGSRVRLSAAGSKQVYPSETNGDNPLIDKEITVRIQSEYYRAWGEYFQRRVGGQVTIDDANETASVTLVTQSSKTIDFGAAGTATSGFNLKGSGGDPTFVDSYNSSKGDYDTSRSYNGRVIAASNVNLGGGVTVYGDVVVPNGNYVNINGNAEIQNGTVRHEDIDVERPSGRVSERVQAASTNNNNSDVSALSDNSLDGDGDVTLPAGTYYIDDELRLSGRTLTLEPSADEEVTLAVTGNIDIVNGGSISVAGDNSEEARLYTTADDVNMNDGSVNVSGERAGRFWLYGTEDMTGSMSSSRFVGVYYAPGDDSSLDMRSGSTIFGSMAVGNPDLKSGSTIHYDLALKGEPPYQTSATVVSYLHVSENTVVVEED